MAVHEHKAKAPAAPLRLAVVTVSDTRTAATDAGGDLAAALIGAAGFQVAGRDIVPDDEEAIRARARALVAGGGVDAVVLTGGTGISPRDRTVEAVLPLIERRLDGFGELFRMLSFAEIGPAAMLSRAVGGVAGRVALFAVPGSPAGVRLALERLILPELRHVLGELRRGEARRRDTTGGDATSAPHDHDHDHGHDHGQTDGHCD